MRPLAIFRRILGTMLFLFGIVGLILPIVPGIVFMGVGLYILSIDSPGLKMRLDAMRSRSPSLDRALHSVERLLRRKKEPDQRDTLEP